MFIESGKSSRNLTTGIPLQSNISHMNGCIENDAMMIQVVLSADIGVEKTTPWFELVIF